MRRISTNNIQLDIYFLGLITILSFVFCSSFVIPFKKIIFEDAYLQFCAHFDDCLIFFSKDHRIPLWSYYFGGGYPVIKHPFSISLSPIFFLFILPFGTASGIKLMILFSYMAGGIGFFILARKILECNRVAALIITLFFLFNGFIPYRINTGGTTISLWFFLPLIIYTLFLLKVKWHFTFYCAYLIVFLIISGFSLYFAPLILLLFLLVLFDASENLENRAICPRNYIARFFFVIIIVFFTAAIKIFPLMELLKLNFRSIAYADVVPATFNKLFLAFFSKGPYADGNEIAMGIDNGLGIGAVSYFGVIPFLFFLAAIFFCFKKVWKLLLILFLFLLIMLGQNSPVDLFRLIWHLPLFNSINEVSRYFIFPLIFIIPFTIGYFFSSDVFNKLNKNAKITIYLIAIISIADMFFVNSKYFNFASNYNENVPELWLQNDFFNVKTVEASLANNSDFSFSKRYWSDMQRRNLEDGLHYYLLRQNIGLINWVDELRLETHAVPKYYVTFGYGDYWRDFRRDLSEKNGIIKNKDYRGECYFSLDKNNKVNGILWKTNEMIVNVDQVSPDQLIINQNYDPSWKSNLGKVFDANGLIGVDLNKPVKGKIVLSYRLKSFYAGMVASAISIALGLLYCLLRRCSK